MYVYTFILVHKGGCFMKNHQIHIFLFFYLISNISISQKAHHIENAECRRAYT